MQATARDTVVDQRIINASKKFLDVVQNSGHEMKPWMLLQLDMILKANDWLEAWVALRSSGDEKATPASILESTTCSARLTQCFKATKALDVLTNKALDVESKMEVEQHEKFAVLLTFDCRQCVEGLLSHDGLMDVMNLKAVGTQERLSELGDQLAEATKGYGGFSGGKVKKAVSWKDGLPDTSSLDELLIKAKSTIDSIEGEAAEVLCNSLAEDWRDWGQGVDGVDCVGVDGNSPGAALV